MIDITQIRQEAENAHDFCEYICWVDNYAVDLCDDLIAERQRAGRLEMLLEQIFDFSEHWQYMVTLERAKRMYLGDVRFGGVERRRVSRRKYLAIKAVIDNGDTPGAKGARDAYSL